MYKYGNKTQEECRGGANIPGRSLPAGGLENQTWLVFTAAKDYPDIETK